MGKASFMGKTRMQRVQAYKKRQWEKVLKCIIYPPAIATALVVQAAKNSQKSNKKQGYKTEKKP